MKPIYKQAKKELEAQEIDFSKNVYSLTGSEEKLLEQAAKKYGLHWTIMSNNQKHKRQIVFSYKEGVEFANNIK